MLVGLTNRILAIKVLNRTTSDIKDIRITFLEDFKGRETFIKKIKPNDFKSTGISLLDMEKKQQYSFGDK